MMRKAKIFSTFLIMLIILSMGLPGIGLAQTKGSPSPTPTPSAEVKKTSQEPTTTSVRPRVVKATSKVATKTSRKTVRKKGSRSYKSSKSSKVILAQRQKIAKQQREINRLRKSKIRYIKTGDSSGTAVFTLTDAQMDAIATAVAGKVKISGTTKISEADMAAIKKAISEEVAAQFSKSPSSRTDSPAEARTWPQLLFYDQWDNWLSYIVLFPMFLLSYLFTGLWTWSLAHPIWALVIQVIGAVLLWRFIPWLIRVGQKIKDRPVIGTKPVVVRQLKPNAPRNSINEDDYIEQTKQVNIKQSIPKTIWLAIPEIFRFRHGRTA